MRQNILNRGTAVTYKVSTVVAEYLLPDPIAPAAAIWTAHPQPMEAMAKQREFGSQTG